MQEYCATLVRIYSKYTEQIPAPLGFDTPSRSLETSKWQHFPVSGNLVFLILKEYDNSYIVKILRNEIILEYMRVSLIGSDKVVQFTARSPIISCKYVVRENSGIFIKRFQIVLHNDEDFARVYAALSDLRFVVRSARVGIPLDSQVPQSLQTLKVGPINHQSSHKKSPKHILSETVPEKISPTSQNEELPIDKPYGLYPSYQSNWEAQVCNFGYLSNTQIALDDFQQPNLIQTQRGMPTEENDMLCNEIGLRSNLLIPENRPQPLAETECHEYSNIIQGAIGAAAEKRPLAIEESLTLINKRDENCARLTESDISPLRETPSNERTIRIIDSKNKVDISDENSTNPKDFYFESKRKKHMNESIAKVKKNGSSQNMKISKNLIKQKLQDDNFMQWVAKVEAVLSKMTTSKG